MRKIILTTVGTMGDLHPFIAIGLALAKRGVTPVLAVPEDHVAKCRRAGLETVAIRPGFEATRQRMGVSHEEAVRRMIANQRFMLEQLLLPGLPDYTRALDDAAADADAIVASTFVFAAPIVAEKRGLPLISIILQPMAMLSAYDPPHTPDFWMMKAPPVGLIGRIWNRSAYTLIRWVLHRMYGPRIDRVRAEHGLPPRGARRLLEPDDRSMLRLGCYSPQLAPCPPDAPASTHIVGFPTFDSDSGKTEALAPEIGAFLAAGPPPLVFTLGTFAVDSAGGFYEKSVEIARRLGMRAILLVGGDTPPTNDGDVLRCGYAPHSLLFPQAAAIIHHGGVGTTGQALRAGKPQLVVPHMGDQNDNAQRIARLGAGLRLHPDRFTIARATRRIATVLQDPSYRATGAKIALRMVDEDGADAAADVILRAIGPAQPSVRANPRHAA